MADQNPDIVTITEVKPKNGTIPELPTLSIQGYQLFTSDMQKQDTKGTCIYV